VASGGTVTVKGLNEFRAAVRKAAGAAPREIPLALKRAGVPILTQAAANAPHRSGRLASGYKVAVRGTTASIVSSVPYAGGAEWGSHGKWSGFEGAPPRIVWPAVEAQEGNVELILENELRDIVGIYGWAV
jgi:hypothetical protein